MKCEFPDAPITVTLTGQEWTAILIRLAHGKAALSVIGCEAYGVAGARAGRAGSECVRSHSQGREARTAIGGSQLRYRGAVEVLL
jgi:hypothetical protein